MSGETDFDFMDDIEVVQVAEEAPEPPVVESTPEPVAEPAPEPVQEAVEPPEPSPEPAATEAPAAPPQGFVPYGALAEARGRSKDLEAENRELRAQLESKAEPVDIFVDPEGFQAQNIDQPIQAMRQELAQLRQESAIRSYVQASEAQFTQTTPDYTAALNALQKSRYDELSLIMEPERIAQVIREDVESIALQSMQGGHNAAEVIYKMAVARGYQPPAKEAEGKIETESKPDMTALQKVAEASKSLATAQGEATTSEITLEDVSAMDPADIAAMDIHEMRKYMVA